MFPRPRNLGLKVRQTRVRAQQKEKELLTVLFEVPPMSADIWRKSTCCPQKFRGPANKSIVYVILFEQSSSHFFVLFCFISRTSTRGLFARPRNFSQHCSTSAHRKDGSTRIIIQDRPCRSSSSTSSSSFECVRFKTAHFLGGRISHST